MVVLWILGMGACWHGVEVEGYLNILLLLLDSTGVKIDEVGTLVSVSVLFACKGVSFKTEVVMRIDCSISLWSSVTDCFYESICYSLQTSRGLGIFF